MWYSRSPWVQRLPCSRFLYFLMSFNIRIIGNCDVGCRGIVRVFAGYT